MFVSPDKSRDLCLKIMRGQPTAHLLWYTAWWSVEVAAKEAGYTDPIDFMMRDLARPPLKTSPAHLS